ncbi:hypothetical protein M1271_06165 [Patescibacteria group bacterium]|nr:hypothetical protein [Patescibacteria group bacterium]MCL5797876.1 hypothetical protein [Patescibacteria group bacterium]
MMTKDIKVIDKTGDKNSQKVDVKPIEKVDKKEKDISNAESVKKNV